MYGQKQKFVGYVPANPNKIKLCCIVGIWLFASVVFTLAYISGCTDIQQCLLYVVIVWLCYLLTDK